MVKGSHFCFYVHKLWLKDILFLFPTCKDKPNYSMSINVLTSMRLGLWICSDWLPALNLIIGWFFLTAHMQPVLWGYENRSAEGHFELVLPRKQRIPLWCFMLPPMVVFRQLVYWLFIFLKACEIKMSLSYVDFFYAKNFLRDLKSAVTNICGVENKLLGAIFTCF